MFVVTEKANTICPSTSTTCLLLHPNTQSVKLSKFWRLSAILCFMWDLFICGEHESIIHIIPTETTVWCDFNSIGLWLLCLYEWGIVARGARRRLPVSYQREESWILVIICKSLSDAIQREKWHQTA